MSTQTIRDLASELHKPVTELLSQLKDAGVEAKDEQSAISPSEKMALLSHLQKLARVSGTIGAGGAGRITLKRTEKTELKLGGGRGLPSKTVNIEVKKRRTYVAQEELPVAGAAADEAAEAKAEAGRDAEEALLRQQADREAAAARAAAEAEARKAQEEAKRLVREEEEARVRAEAEAVERSRAEHADKLKNDPIYRAKWEAESARRRAQENLARSAEAARQIRNAPPATGAARPAPGGLRGPGAPRPAAPAEGYPELFAEAGERIDAALAWIRAKEKGRIAIVSHSMGARMTLAWIQRRPTAPIGAWVALSISTGEIDDLPRIRFPVFDVYAEKDFPQVIAKAHDRSLVLRGIPGSSQAMIYGTGHYFGGREKELAALLDQLLARELR